MTHITIAAVTIFCTGRRLTVRSSCTACRCTSFAFWLWLTTGMLTKHWTAIHRKHHAKCETVEDPHSPQIFGIRKLLFQGAELYRDEGRNKDTLERYGYGTPDDWLERNIYSHDRWGIGTMVVINTILLGPIGITIWAIQMLWIPFLAAGVINGIGHYWGYRTFQPEDASRNILPWGILIGGEELHNNHHTRPRPSSRSSASSSIWVAVSAALSLRPGQGAKTPLKGPNRAADSKTLEALITNRYEVMANIPPWRSSMQALSSKD